MRPRSFRLNIGPTEKSRALCRAYELAPSIGHHAERSGRSLRSGSGESIVPSNAAPDPWSGNPGPFPAFAGN